MDRSKPLSCAKRNIFMQFKKYFIFLCCQWSVPMFQSYKHFCLKDLCTSKHLGQKIQLFKVETCSNPKVDKEGAKNHQWQSFLL